MSLNQELIDRLTKIPNVGPSVARDLISIGVRDPQELAQMDPDEMYERLCRLTGTRQDPCVWDTFAAVVDFANTGERKPWWAFTAMRQEHWAKRR